MVLLMTLANVNCANDNEDLDNTKELYSMFEQLNGSKVINVLKLVVRPILNHGSHMGQLGGDFFRESIVRTKK